MTIAILYQWYLKAVVPITLDGNISWTEMDTASCKLSCRANKLMLHRCCTERMQSEGERR